MNKKLGPFQRKDDHNLTVEVTRREYGLVVFKPAPYDIPIVHTEEHFDERYEPVPAAPTAVTEPNVQTWSAAPVAQAARFASDIEKAHVQLEKLRNDPLHLLGQVFLESPSARALIDQLSGMADVLKAVMAGPPVVETHSLTATLARAGIITKSQALRMLLERYLDVYAALGMIKQLDRDDGIRLYYTD